MAVPKENQNLKKNARKQIGKRKIYSSSKSLSLAKSMLRGKTTSFIQCVYAEEE
jgi:hypothetical protein